MSKEKYIDINQLQVQYEDFMLKLGKEKRLEYYGSSLDDLYIMLKIEHDGVYDYVLVDFYADVVDMRIYDEYKFIKVDHFKLTTEIFMNMIDNLDTYSINMNKLLNESEDDSNAPF